jgi:predicted patatin/cPLA2 family phospholipase
VKIARVNGTENGGKVAIVASGGGMMCAYSAGVLQALAERYSLTPDFVIGTSGSSASLVYFAAGQTRVLNSLWLNHACSSQFISSSGVNISYMVEEVLRVHEPLDFEALRKSKIRFLVSATDVETGEPCYFSSDDGDIEAALRATASFPLLSDPVSIRGKLYADGAIGSPIWRTVQEAIDRGATKIVVIDNSHKQTVWFRLLLWRLPKGLRQAVERAYDEPEFLSVPSNVEIAYITPTKALPVGVFTTDREKVARTMHIGYEDALQNADLQKIIPCDTHAQTVPLSSSLSSPQ